MSPGAVGLDDLSAQLKRSRDLLARLGGVISKLDDGSVSSDELREFAAICAEQAHARRRELAALAPKRWEQRATDVPTLSVMIALRRATQENVSMLEGLRERCHDLLAERGDL